MLFAQNLVQILVCHGQFDHQFHLTQGILDSIMIYLCQIIYWLIYHINEVRTAGSLQRKYRSNPCQHAGAAYILRQECANTQRNMGVYQNQ